MKNKLSQYSTIFFFTGILIILVGSISTIIPSSYAVQDLQKIECVDDNLNINGIDLNQLTQQQQDQIKRLAGIDYEDADRLNSNYNDNDYGLSHDSFSIDNNLVNVCVNANLNHQKVTPPPPPPVISLNKEWFVCDEEEDIDCTVRSESNIAFEPPSSGNYIACTEQDNNCPFVADTGLNIEVSGNSPTPNTIPALVGTQATIDIGSGDFDVNESLSTESQSLFDQLLISVQNGPAGIAYDPVNERMYVANLFSDNISVIPTATNTVVGTPISVGDAPIDMAYDPVNERMYVTNLASNTVSVISTATNTVIGTPIPVGSRPAGIAYDPVNERMYVANYNFGGSGTVSVISTATNTVIGTPIPVGNGPRDIAYDPVNERMYVANFGSGFSSTVSVISTATNMVIDTITAGNDSPSEIAYDPVNERMYVTNRGGTVSDTVSVISTATNTVVGSPIPVGTSAASIAYDPVNERMYVTNAADSGTVSVISTATNTVIGSPIPVGGNPQGIAYDPVNERMYVTNFGSNTVSVLYLSANKVCQDSGFDGGELRTYESNGQMIEQITCVNFVGECSGNIQGGDTKECTIQDYAVRITDITDASAITTAPTEEINKQQEKQETEDEEQIDTTDKGLLAKSPFNAEISTK